MQRSASPAGLQVLPTLTVALASAGHCGHGSARRLRRRSSQPRGPGPGRGSTRLLRAGALLPRLCHHSAHVADLEREAQKRAEGCDGRWPEAGGWEACVGPHSGKAAAGPSTPQGRVPSARHEPDRAEEPAPRRSAGLCTCEALRVPEGTSIHGMQGDRAGAMGPGCLQTPPSLLCIQA